MIARAAPAAPRLETFDDGYVIAGDCTDPRTQALVSQLAGQAPLIVADPPYGNIVREEWDRVDGSDDALYSSWMAEWTLSWAETCLLPGGAFYVWGGVGKPGFRPFLRYLSEVERPGKFEMANLITWAKKRAYGVGHNYLWTREECAYFVNGHAKKPRAFKIPLLDTKRGYAGYNDRYPAKSEFYRRTNVWADITEILRGKLHPTQKSQRVLEIPIEVHTDAGEWVLDLFGGAGTTAFAARKLGRKFIVIEKDEAYASAMVVRLRAEREQR